MSFPRGTPIETMIRTLVDPATTDKDRWLLRLAILELAHVDPTPEALAFIGNTTIEKAVGAMGVLQADGFVRHEADE